MKSSSSTRLLSNLQDVSELSSVGCGECIIASAIIELIFDIVQKADYGTIIKQWLLEVGTLIPVLQQYIPGVGN